MMMCYPTPKFYKFAKRTSSSSNDIHKDDLFIQLVL
jgi:hypothetical protein